MTFKIPATQRARLSESVARHLGLHFPPERWPDLERGVLAAAKDYRGPVENYLEDLLAGRQMDVLAHHVTIGETYFFREIHSLQVLEQRIVPDWLASRRASDQQFKIWSAGCATGEEPYSLAIVLSKWMARLPKPSIEILATDVNTKSLRKAADGIYTNWSFRGTPPWVQRTCFHATEDGKWSIAPAIRRMVHFTTLNLMDDEYPSLAGGGNGLDVIFCRNVLMYFTPQGRRNVIRQFHRCLAPDGWLVVSPAETSQEFFNDFAPVSFGDVTLYRKSHPQVPATVMVALDYGDRPIVPLAAGHDTPPREPALALVPSLPEPLAASYPQALALYERGHYDEAGQMTAALLLRNPIDAAALLLLARIHANQGNLVQALMWCDQAITADKLAARAHYLRAAILQEQGSLPEAMLALKQAVYADPDCVMGHFALGNLAWRQGKLKQSEKNFENVLLLLARYKPEDIVPESDGLSAARLRAMIALKRIAGVATHQPGNLKSSGY